MLILGVLFMQVPFLDYLDLAEQGGTHGKSEDQTGG